MIVPYKTKKLFNFFWVFGGSIFWILSNFSGNGVMLFPDTTCPKYCICFFKKLHLISLSFKSASLSFLNRLLRCSRWVSISRLNTRMSSKYPKAKVSPDKTSFTNLWKYAGACANPNGHLLKFPFTK